VKRRMLSIAVALLLAVFGTGAVLAYINGANARAITGLKAVSVLVAQQEIPAGTSVAAAQQAGSLRAETMPARSVSADAVSTITADLRPLVMSADVQPGQVLLRLMLVAAAQVSGGLAIPGSMVAVTIPLCLPQAVAGYVHAGSQVAIFDTVSREASRTRPRSAAPWRPGWCCRGCRCCRWGRGARAPPPPAPDWAPGARRRAACW
jgi:pilus assembly protein CpaB